MKMSVTKFTSIAFVCSGIILHCSPSYAGPFILAGTDADDHGSATASANVDGWLFMQKVLENLAPAAYSDANQPAIPIHSSR